MIVLDVNKMKDFEVDNSSLPACVSFGPGHLLGDLSLLMYHRANALLPAGLSPSVGVSGQILGTVSTFYVSHTFPLHAQDTLHQNICLLLSVLSSKQFILALNPANAVGDLVHLPGSALTPVL